MYGGGSREQCKEVVLESNVRRWFYRAMYGGGSREQCKEVVLESNVRRWF